VKSKEESLAFARDQVGKDPVATHLGLEVAEVQEGMARIRLIPKEHHLNILGRVHGSTIYAMVDQALAVASCSLPGPAALVMEVNIHFLGAAEPGVELVAVAKPLELKRSIGLWEVKVQGPNGEKVAHASGMTYHKPA
jgi:acyl-CoA thioesterase